MNRVDVATTAARKLLLRLLAASPDIAPQELPEEIDWQELYRLSQDHQVFPLVYQGLKPLRHLIPEPFAYYRALFAANLVRNAAIDRELDRTLQRFALAGLQVRCRRGPQLARLAYGDVGLRVFADLDLYLSESDVLPAMMLLQQAGYRAELTILPEQWRGLARIANQAPLRHLQKDWLIELHWRPFSPHYAFELDFLVDPDHRESDDVEAELLLLLVHGGKHLWRQLKWLVDIDRLLCSSGPVDWSRLFALAAQAGCLRLVRLGLLLRKTINAEPYPPDVEAQLTADTTVVRLANRFRQDWFNLPQGRHFLGEYLSHLMLRERWSDRLRLCWRWPFWPRPEDWLAFPFARDSLALLVLLRPLRLVRNLVRR